MAIPPIPTEPVTMFGKPMATITEVVHALPYVQFPNIVVAYPSINDWRRLYDYNETRGARWTHEMYADFKRRHERTVTRELDEVANRFTGRAVMAEKNEKAAYPIMILPFDFLPRDSKSWRAETGAVTRNEDQRNGTDAGVQICGKVHDKPVCVIATGAGSSVDIYFTPSRITNANESADATLLHELVHAVRNVKGVSNQLPMDGGYNNQEEFLAVLIANIYQSEKQVKLLLDYRGVPINAATFLDRPRLNPAPRDVLKLLRSKQPTLFAALAWIQPKMASFNPIRQVDAELKGR